MTRAVTFLTITMATANDQIGKEEQQPPVQVTIFQMFWLGCVVVVLTSGVLLFTNQNNFNTLPPWPCRSRMQLVMLPCTDVVSQLLLHDHSARLLVQLLLHTAF